jgi:hypothetical protein
MTRKRKKLKTRTKISVRKAASAFPASQRALRPRSPPGHGGDGA